MTNFSSNAKDEVEELHNFVEQVEQENKKWQRLSVLLAVLSVTLGSLSVALSLGIVA